MGRHSRCLSETGYYHVVTRGNRRQAVFRTAADYQWYARIVQQACAERAVTVAHFCLMPNHVHLLMRAAQLTPLSDTMHDIQRRYWFYVRRAYGWTGHLWQGRFHSFPVEDDGYLLEAARYIERNPLEAQLTPTLAEYPWSSYRFYTEGRVAVLPVQPTPTYLALGESADVRQRRYHQFVETPQPYDKSMRRKLQQVTAYA